MGNPTVQTQAVSQQVWDPRFKQKVLQRRAVWVLFTHNEFANSAVKYAVIKRWGNQCNGEVPLNLTCRYFRGLYHVVQVSSKHTWLEQIPMLYMQRSTSWLPAGATGTKLNFLTISFWKQEYPLHSFNWFHAFYGCRNKYYYPKKADCHSLQSTNTSRFCANTFSCINCSLQVLDFNRNFGRLWPLMF